MRVHTSIWEVTNAVLIGDLLLMVLISRRKRRETTN